MHMKMHGCDPYTVAKQMIWRNSRTGAEISNAVVSLCGHEHSWRSRKQKMPQYHTIMALVATSQAVTINTTTAHVRAALQPLGVCNRNLGPNSQSDPQSPMEYL